MPKKQITRNEQKQEYTWDLTTIYATEKAFYEEMNLLKTKMLEISKFNGKLNNAKNLLAYLYLDSEISRVIYKLSTYSHLHYDEDMSNTKSNQMYEETKNLIYGYSKLSSYAVPEIRNISASELEKYYLEEPKLFQYKFDLQNITRYKNHILSSIEEELISKLRRSMNSSYSIYTTMTDNDFTFGNLKNDNNELVELTQMNYISFMSSKNRNVRKNAFNKLHQKYGEYINTIAKILKNNIESNVDMAKTRNYDNALSESLFEDNIDPSVYRNLINSVNNNLDIVHKYYDLKREVLNLKEFHIYDVYVSLIDKINDKYSYEEAKKLVKVALKPLGDDYGKVLDKAFNEGWIDVYSNKGKRSGAYSSGCYDTNPYILLNYEDEYESVSTLAHELGHSVHSYYSRTNNPENLADYSIFIAEITSLTNELLLNNYFLKNAKSKKEQLFFINELLETYRGTLIRQTMFSEFEEKMYQSVENDVILTSEFLSEEYYKLNKKYFGKNVSIDKNIKYEWARIPHFYYNFYAYKYAIGISIATYIVKNVLENKNNMLEKYMQLLKSGGSDYPLELLKIIDIDLTKLDVFETAMKEFGKLIDEFKKIYEGDLKYEKRLL